MLTVMLTVIRTLTGRSICSVSSYYENNDNNVRSICSGISYFDNNGEVYM